VGFEPTVRKIDFNCKNALFIGCSDWIDRLERYDYVMT